MNWLKKTLKNMKPYFVWLLLKIIWIVRLVVWDIVNGTWEFIKLVVLAIPRLVIFILRWLLFGCELTWVIVIPYIIRALRRSVWHIQDTGFANGYAIIMNLSFDWVVEFGSVIVKYFRFLIIRIRPQTVTEVYKWTYFPDIGSLYLIVPLISDMTKSGRERGVFFCNQLRLRWGENIITAFKFCIWFIPIIVVSCFVLTDHLVVMALAYIEHVNIYPSFQDFIIPKRRVLVTALLFPYFRISLVFGAVCSAFFVLSRLVGYIIEWVLNRHYLGLSSKHSFHFQLTDKVCVPLYWLSERLLFELVHSFTWISHAVCYIGVLFYMWFLCFFKWVYRSMFSMSWFYYCGWQPLWIRRQEDWIVRLHNDYLSLKWWLGPDYEIVYKILMYWARAVDYYVLFYVKYYIISPLIFIILFIPRLIIHYIHVALITIDRFAVADTITWTDWIPQLIVTDYDLFFHSIVVPTIVFSKVFLRTVWYGPFSVKLEALSIAFQVNFFYWYNNLRPFSVAVLGRYALKFFPADDSSSFVLWAIFS